MKSWSGDDKVTVVTLEIYKIALEWKSGGNNEGSDEYGDDWNYWMIIWID
jgi:hypothetical protein